MTNFCFAFCAIFALSAVSVTRSCKSSHPPCRNGSVCQPCVLGQRGCNSGVFRCVCLPGFAGPLCEKDVRGKLDDPCVKSPCFNEGVCVLDPSTIRGCTCTCSNGFLPPLCRFRSRPDGCPNPDACKNGGSDCQANEKGRPGCICLPGWRGRRCGLKDRERGFRDNKPEGRFCKGDYNFMYKNHCYRFVSDSAKSYDDARKDCRDTFGEIVAVLSEQQESALHNRMMDESTDPNWWIGAKMKATGGFKWENRPFLNFTDYVNWKNGVESTTDCSYANGANGWVESNCSVSRNFICQKPADVAFSVPSPENAKCVEPFPSRFGDRCAHHNPSAFAHYDAAIDYCANKSGELMGFTSRDEYLLQYTYYRGLSPTVIPQIHIGLKRTAPGQPFYWPNGEALQAKQAFWARGEPSSTAGNCVVNVGTGWEGPRWKVWLCSTTARFLCTRPAEITPEPECPTEFPHKCGDNCFAFIHDKKRNYTEARDYCRNYGVAGEGGSWLLIARSPEFHFNVANIIAKEYATQDNQIYIAARKTGGKWVWPKPASGDREVQLIDRFWKAGQPGTGDCVTTFGDVNDKNKGKWVTVDCAEEHNFVCAKSQYLKEDDGA